MDRFGVRSLQPHRVLSRRRNLTIASGALYGPAETLYGPAEKWIDAGVPGGSAFGLTSTMPSLIRTG
jgi:hypothetical protein